MDNDTFIDLFSDTKTKPSTAMRRFMMSAPVGDEQKDEDPTVNLLCERVADLLGKETAVFLPSGTMCNEIAIAVHCRPGDEIICERSAHIVTYEAGGPAALSGAMVHPIDGKRGIFDADTLAKTIRAESRYAPRSKLVSIEQTSNLGGGTIWPLETIRDVMARARQSQLLGHLDGARLLNASVKSGIAARSFAEPFDSAWIDFTKGLGAPVGAVLAGSRDFISEAWRLKHRWGGAMRQAGIVAAAGLYALDHNVERLVEDHENAQRLALALSGMPGVAIDPQHVETNIVFFDIAETGWKSAELVELARKQGIGLGAFGPTTIRAVTHLDVDRAGITRAIHVLETLLAEDGRRFSGSGHA
jgi:threonine aldolase